MVLFTEDFLNARREELLNAVGDFEYKLGAGDWQKAEVSSKKIEGNAAVFNVYVPGSGTDDIITAVRFYDQDGNIAGERTVQLTRTSLQSTLIRFSFPLTELT